MDDTTKRLWVEADAATRAEVQADERLGRDGKNNGKAARDRLRAWHRLIAWRRKVWKATVGDK
jgi:hypothetical protein